MRTLTLEIVPEELVEQLQREAELNQRSLQRETLVRLEQSVEERRKDVTQTVESPTPTPSEDGASASPRRLLHRSREARGAF